MTVPAPRRGVVVAACAVAGAWCGIVLWQLVTSRTVVEGVLLAAVLGLVFGLGGWWISTPRAVRVTEVSGPGVTVLPGHPLRVPTAGRVVSVPRPRRAPVSH